MNYIIDEDTVNMVLEVLGQQPFVKVAELICRIQDIEPVEPIQETTDDES